MFTVLMSVNPRKVYCTHITLLFALLFSLSGVSQEYYHQLMISDGLPSNEIYDIHQDHNGLLWFATDHGIASYNGSYFTRYTIEDGLPDRVVFKFYPQEDGNIWCTTKSNALFYFNPDVLQFHHYPFNEQLHRNLGQNFQIRELKLYKDGSLRFRSIKRPSAYFVSKDGEIRQLNPKKSKHCYSLYEIDVYRNEEGYPFLDYSDTFESHSRGLQRINLSAKGNNAIVMHSNGFGCFQNGKLVQSREEQGHHFLDAEALDEGYWIGTINRGIILYDVHGNKTAHFAHGITGTCYLEDRDGGHWIGTQDDGVLYYPNNKVKSLMSSKNLGILSLCKSKDGHLIYTAVKGEIYTYSLTTSEVLNMHKSEVLYAPAEYYPSIDRYYQSIFLSKDVLLQQKLKHAKVRKYSDNVEKPPLLITYSAVLDKNFQSVYRLSSTRHKLLIDAEFLGKKVVIAESDTLTIISTDGHLLAKKCVGSDIKDIDVHRNNIYCATEGKGVLVFDAALKPLFSVNSRDGLPDNYVSEVLIKENTIWIGTQKGLAKAEATSSGIKVNCIRTNNGLSNEEITDLLILKDQMYIATKNGVFHFHLNDWETITNEFVKIYFQKKRLLVNGTRVSSMIDLNHRSNEIEVRFDLISFVNSRDLSFRYRLLGLSNEWNETSDRKVLYKSLPPGEYNLIIQPVINGVPRKETIEQKISILEPYYRTWWFIASVILGIVLATWLFFRYRILEKNRMLIQEILRFIMKRLQPKTNSFVVRSNGRSIRISCDQILFAESNGNYLNIHLEDDKIVIREKISNFNNIVPDPLEYVRVRRSVIVRKDKITGKNSEVVLVRKHEIKIGNTYRKEVDSIQL